VASPTPGTRAASSSVDGRVVRQEQRVAAALGRIDGHDLQERRGLLLGRDALPLHLGRQLRQRGVDAVVDVDRVEIGVGADREADGQRIAAVAAAGRLHVDHLVDAVDLRLDDLGHALLDRLRPRRRDRWR
jgi:hypothetical protein